MLFIHQIQQKLFACCLTNPFFEFLFAWNFFTGKAGPAGAPGPQGDRGERGFRGAKGEKGDKGGGTVTVRVSSEMLN